MRIATGSLHYSTRRWKSREAGFPWCVSLSGRHTGLADTATRRHNPYGQLFWVASSKALLCSHPHCRERKGHKNTRQVTPWGVLPGGRNLPRFFLWIGTKYRPFPKGYGRMGDRGDAGNRTPVRCGVNGASPCAVYANATFRLRYLHKHIYRRT